jgi:hypothetical protein
MPLLFNNKEMSSNTGITVNLQQRRQPSFFTPSSSVTRGVSPTDQRDTTSMVYTLTEIVLKNMFYNIKNVLNLFFCKICDTLWKCLAGSVNIQVVSGWTVNNKHVYVNLCFGRKKEMYSWQVKCANFLVPQPKFLTLELIGTSDLISKQADSEIAIKICSSSCLLKKCTISTIKRERRKAYGKV